MSDYIPNEGQSDPIDGLSQSEAESIIEQLRTGLPPRGNTSLYSTGMEPFLKSVRMRHLDPPQSGGKIRFVAGSWGSGKTHFLRLVTEDAQSAGWAISTVELSAQEAPFNKFELVLFAIIRNISTKETAAGQRSSAPFGDLLRNALFEEAGGPSGDLASAVTRLEDRLFSETSIDVDVKKVVKAFWDTYVGESTDSAVLEERRGELMQWFSGEAHKPTIRKDHGIQKVVSKENARIILSSITGLIQLLGFKGLLILFDESEMTHSTMSRSVLKQAHNNLLHLLNEVGEVPGLFLIYAAVPEFFTDPKTGIVIYGALAARIGSPPDSEPRALEKVWNLDAVIPSERMFENAAAKIRAIYIKAYGLQSCGEKLCMIAEAELRKRITLIASKHGQYESINRWRIVVKETVKLLDLSLECIDLPDPDASYKETKGLLEQMGDD